jgi:hypothetical protein
MTQLGKGLAWTVLALAGPLAWGKDEPPAFVTQDPPYEEFLVIPLRVHILSADELPEVECKLKDSDITRILSKVNGIWHKAGIHFGLEALVREPAARQDRFKATREKEGTASVGLFRILLPDATRRFDGLHVYFIHQFGVNGIYMGDDFTIVKETAELKRVSGGLDEPLPRVTAHELGHALELPHRQDGTNLLSSGTTGIGLNAKEVSIARARAREIKGTIAVPDLKQRAFGAVRRSEVAGARRDWTWLSEIPGDEAATAKRHLEVLRSEPRPGGGEERRSVP